MSTISTTTLPLLPIPNGVFFPEMVVTVAAHSPGAQAAFAAAAAADGNELVAVPQSGGDYSPIGIIVRIEQQGQLPDGGEGAVLRGLRRVRIGQGETSTDGVLHVTVTEIDEAEPTAEAKALAIEYRGTAMELLRLVGGSRLVGMLDGIHEPGALADTLGMWPDLGDDRRRELFETLDVTERITKALAWVKEALAEASVNHDIGSTVQQGFEKDQREAILRRQMASIREELGETDDDEIEGYRARIADGELPEAVAKAAEKELDKLEKMSDQSMESGWIRTWLETVFELPWGERSQDKLDLDAAQAQLDTDHTGLDKVKERIIEFLAVRKLRADRGVDAIGVDEAGVDEAGSSGRAKAEGTILALVGPPGVGKTSLGESIAETMGRKFVRMSLGGIRDEAEIRGHRRTYVGARPGRLVRALTDAGTMNPVILLDEIDKVGNDWRGDPSSALLEVLDPAQNSTFRDHYLETELDLSEVVFIATANVLDTIPAPLLDRMEIIHLEGYTEDEKVAIARDHLLPRLHERNGVTADEVVITDEIVRTVVGDFTREAGVRRLEQRLDRLVRRGVSQLVRNPDIDVITITDDDLRPALGRTAGRDLPAERIVNPGIATGLAVTGAGGDVLFVEVSASEGEPGLTLTGQLGDVMKESSSIALTYSRHLLQEIDSCNSFFDDNQIHLHVPEGSTPKDGPSAGVTMVTALMSLATNTSVKANLAMTGEIGLTGMVLPIGGVKEKVIAARRSGVTTIVLPDGNRKDADELPQYLKDGLDIHFAKTYEDVYKVAFEKN